MSLDGVTLKAPPRLEKITYQPKIRELQLPVHILKKNHSIYHVIGFRKIGQIALL